MTPDSFISSQRSLPSRERSPTPQAAVLLREVVDQLLDDHRLADAGAAEQADLAALRVGREQVDDLDAGLEHLRGRRELLDRRSVAVDRPALDVGVELVALVDRLAQQVE